MQKFDLERTKLEKEMKKINLETALLEPELQVQKMRYEMV
jgi:hypothetical protein